MNIDTYDLILTAIGVTILLAIVVMKVTYSKSITAPIVYLTLSVVLFFLLKDQSIPHLAESPYFGKRLTEMGVILSLTIAGLKIKNPLNRKTWKYSGLLLLVTMPVTIAAVYFLGLWGLGFAPASAMLLGAVIAPTDPVLASDVQTTHPYEDDYSSARLALTTEAGLNDGLAFPFTNMAIAMAVAGAAPSLWFTDWLLTDFLYKIIGGLIVGLALGWILAKIMFLLPILKDYNTKITLSLFTISLTLIPYGVAEILGTYGFIAVFVAACIFRNAETKAEYLGHLHDFSEVLEKIVVATLFLLAGSYFVLHFIDDFQWYMLPTALLIVFIIRPAAGILAMWRTSLPKVKKYIISFYGIRGIGSMYYLLYAFYQTEFEHSKELLALLSVVILLSIFIHGLTARYVIKKWTPSD